jgi:hypothetical protein
VEPADPRHAAEVRLWLNEKDKEYRTAWEALMARAENDEETPLAA